MGKTYYCFEAVSAFNFPVVHHGRRMFVNFSTPVNGVSRYLTADKTLADKICNHRWYRQGLITMRVEEEKEKKVKVAEMVRNAVQPQKPLYQINKMKMSPQIPKVTDIPVLSEDQNSVNDNDAVVEEMPQAEDKAEQAEGMKPAEDVQPEAEDKSEFTIESVDSFTEAREYLRTIGITSPITSKLEMAKICNERGIVFPNYSLE